MYKLLFPVLFLIFSNSLSAQGRYDNCYFGTVGLNFSGWFPTVLTNSQMVAWESAVSISKKNGDLLFYSNGGNSPTAPGIIGAIWNANHQIMENGILGDSSGCISSLQGAVAFPADVDTIHRLTTSVYYIFMRDCVESSFAIPYFNSGLTYCVIDMDANNGLGKVVSKNNTVLPFQTSGDIRTDHEPVAAILNGNNDGWWVFSYNADTLYSIEVNASGIGNYHSRAEGVGTIIFSPSRDHVVVGNQLYDFDAITGDLSFNMSLSESAFAFSSNGKILYGLGSGLLDQYDLTASNIFDSKTTIGSGAIASNIYLAPDARIYLFNTDGTSLPGVIECPNTLGPSCGLSMSSIYLGGRQSGDVFTNIPANFLYQDGIDCNLSVSSYDNQSATFEVYPNPTNGLFTILVNKLEKSKSFKILSVEGKVVFSGMIKEQKEQIDLSSLQEGVYFVEVMGQQKCVIIQ